MKPETLAQNNDGARLIILGIYLVAGIAKTFKHTFTSDAVDRQLVTIQWDFFATSRILYPAIIMYVNSLELQELQTELNTHDEYLHSTYHMEGICLTSAQCTRRLTLQNQASDLKKELAAAMSALQSNQTQTTE